MKITNKMSRFLCFIFLTSCFMSTTGFIVKIKNSHVQFTKEITTAGIVTLNENQALSVFPLADMRSQSDPVCWPLDIILLLDQSTSMQANDAKNYRIDGALEILDRLIMNQQEFCKEAVHRYGLIEFGGSTRVVLNLSEIGPNKSEADYSTYKEKIDSLRCTASNIDTCYNIGGTYPDLAFEKAAELWGKTEDPPTPEGYGERRKVVVILTDGNPDTPEVDDNKEDLDLPSYMCDLISYLKKDIWQNTSVWLLGLSASYDYLENPENLSDYYGCENKKMEINWGTITGNQEKVLGLQYNDQTISLYIDKIVNDEFGYMGEEIKCGDEFSVLPYLQQVQFSFFRQKDSDELVTLSLLDDSGKKIYSVRGGEVIEGEDSTMVLRDDLYVNSPRKEYYVFDLPKPGHWKFEVDSLSDEQCKKYYKANKTPIVATVLLKTPNLLHPIPLISDYPYYNVNQSEYYSIQLKTPDGLSIPIDPDYPLTIQLQWQPPDGTDKLPNGDTISPITLAPTGQDLWVSETPILSPFEGIYSLNISGFVTSLENVDNADTLLFSKDFQYEVGRLESFDFKITVPGEPEDISQPVELSCNKIQNQISINQSLPISVQLVDNNESPVSVDRLLLGGNSQIFKATLSDEAGSLIEEAILEPSNSQIGLYEGELLKVSSDLVACGKTFLKISFLGGYDRSRFYLSESDKTIRLDRKISQGVFYQRLEDTSTSSDAIYEGGLCSTTFNPLRVSIILTGMDGKPLEDSNGSVMEVKKYIADNYNINDLFNIQIFGPNNEILNLDDFVLSDEVTEMGPVLNIDGYQGAIVPGSYTFIFMPNSDVFRPGFIPAMPQGEEQLTIKVQRQYTFLTDPVTCKVSQGAGILLSIIALILICYLLTGGSGGVLEFSSYSDGIEVPANLRLSKTRLFSKKKSDNLARFGIKHIIATHAKLVSVPDPQDYSKIIKVEAAHIIAVDMNDLTFFDQNIPRNESNPLTSEINIIWK